MPETEIVSKVAQIEARAQKAYDEEDQGWFDAAPLDHLTLLWGIACATMHLACDDEVYEALDKRGWFD